MSIQDKARFPRGKKLLTLGGKLQLLFRARGFLRSDQHPCPAGLGEQRRPLPCPCPSAQGAGSRPPAAAVLKSGRFTYSELVPPGDRVSHGLVCDPWSAFPEREAVTGCT